MLVRESPRCFTLTDRRPPDEYRLAAYLDRWPLLSVAEAVAELAALDAATDTPAEEDAADARP
jgi:hypothetical protein